MTTTVGLGIKRIEALQYYVHDLPRAHRFLCDELGFDVVFHSTPKLDEEGRQRSRVYHAGNTTLVLCEPIGAGGRAFRFLRKHPEGVGTIIFEVEDIERAFDFLEARGGTFITDIQRFADDGGTLAMFSITTPFGDTTFRFVERNGYGLLFPGLTPETDLQSRGNPHSVGAIDHITSNFQTMAPALLWMEHVLGFERYWKIEFHTVDAHVRNHDAASGSGLKSVVMWDPHSGVKFANNEPFRPFFKDSQINVFSEDHRGDGVQHAALTVTDILSTVRSLRKDGVQFMPTPASYYDLLPERLQRSTVGAIDEDLGVLRELQILVDGERPHEYLLQIFLKDAAARYGDKEAGPFFFELIQRKGDRGFGGGNFRALFESIEREQLAMRKAPART